MKKTLPLMIVLSVLCLCLPARAQEEEVVHTVQKGDTLWDISNQYLKTPWNWPLIWANNENITNPHLIYPGDKVIISQKGGVVQITVIPADKSGEKVYTLEQIAGQKEKTMVLAPNYACLMYVPAPLTTKGNVLGNEDSGTMAAQGDTILIQTQSETATHGGQAIITRISEVKLPSTNSKASRTLGYLYKVAGLAKVRDVQSGIVRARVTYANQEIKAGDLVSDEISQLKPLTLTLNQPKLSADGQIVDIYDAVVGATTADVVITDIGANHGVSAGSLLSIYKRIPVKDGKTVEDYQGLVLVIQTLPESSLALVMDSKEPLAKGFKVSAK